MEHEETEAERAIRYFIDTLTMVNASIDKLFDNPDDKREDSNS